MLALGRAASNPVWTRFAVLFLAYSSLSLSDASRADGELAEDLALARSPGNSEMLAVSLVLLGDAAQRSGRRAFSERWTLLWRGSD